MYQHIKRSGINLIAASGIVLIGLVGPAEAQRGGGGGGFRLDPEKQAAAWKLQAEGVAHDLKLDDAATGKLAAAYAKAREAHGEEMQKLRDAGQRGPGMFQEMQTINDDARGDLGDSLKAFLDADQANDALASLGTFNNQWDRMADTIAGMKLEEPKHFATMATIKAYIVDVDAARAEAMAAMDFESMRESSQQLKAALDEKLKLLLTAAQINSWNEATTFRRGGRGGGGGAGPGGGGGSRRQN